MSSAELIALAGWLAAGGAGALALAGRRRYGALELRVAETAHEVRGPLCTVSLALDGLAGPEPDRARRAAAVELELRRAGRALEDLTEPSRERRRDARPSCHAGAVLAAAEAGWRALAAAHGAELRVELAGVGDTHARVDPVRLAQAVGNLVANAAEHGGGTVSVLVRASSGVVRVEVADEGPGLPAPVRALVAGASAGRPAQRRHALRFACRRRRPGRRGHGLAVVAAIAERCGGRLAAAPAARGARLVLELPSAEAPVARDARGASSAGRRA